MTTLTSLVAMAALAAVACNDPAPVIVHAAPPAQSSADQRRFTVTGTATLEVAPDVLDVMMTLSVKRRKADDAVAQLRADQTKLQQQLFDAGLLQKHELEVDQFNVRPLYEWRKDRQVFLGYEATGSLVASLREFHNVGGVMQAATENGVTQLQTRFRSTEMTAKKEAVREMALKAARDKARQMSAAVDAKLGPVVAIAELTNSWQAMSGGVANAYRAVERPEEVIAPNAQQLTLSVQVTWELA